MATRPGRLPNLRVVADSVEELRASLKMLAEKEVLVGFPEDTSARTDAETKSPVDITNAALGYIHDNGAPEQNIPARPFMVPGILEARETLTRQLTSIARDVLLRRGVGAVDEGFERVGLRAQFALRKKINEGIPPPLSEWTLRDRARRGRVGAMWELAWREAGAPATTELAKPLIDTGQLRNAINYVVRLRRNRRT